MGLKSIKVSHKSLFWFAIIVLLSLIVGLQYPKLRLANEPSDVPAYSFKWGVKAHSKDGEINYSQGIVTDSNGNIYVADIGNSRVQKFSSSGEYISKWGSYGTGNGQFGDGFDIAINSENTIYVVDTSNSRVQTFSADGEYLSQWGSSGSGNGEFNYPSSITVDPSGNVYVADAYNNRVQKFTSDGTYITQWTVYGHPDYRITIVESDLSGNIYLFAFDSTSVQKFTSTGEYILEFGTYGSGDGQFNDVKDFGFNSSGEVYVVDSGVSRIQKFSSSGEYITKWGTYGSGNGQFSTPTSIRFSSDDSIYIGDAGNYRIQKFSSEMAYISQFGTWGEGIGELSSAQGVDINSQGNIYVVDSGDNRVQTFSPDGIFLDQWGSIGSNNGQFNYPTGIAIDEFDNVYVVDFNNQRIQKFSNSGEYITQWGSSGTADGQFIAPFGIAVDGSGNVYVTDMAQARIQKFTSTGIYISQWGTQGSGDGQFSVPNYIAIDESDNVYVSDSANHRVQKFTSTGIYISQWGTQGSGDGQFINLNGIEIDPTGYLYAADSGNSRIQKFTVDGDYLGQWGSLGTDNGQFSTPTGIAVDLLGNIYVNDSDNNRIQYFVYPESVAPVLSQIETSTSNTGATITWNTNENASSHVEYGLNNSYGYLTEETDTSPGVQSHSVSLSGLLPCATYHYRVRSKDTYLNMAVGDDLTFTTSGCTGDAIPNSQSDSVISNSLGGTLDLVTSNSEISLTVPPLFNSVDASFQIKQLDKNSTIATTSVPGGKTVVGSNIYDIRALNDIDNVIETFSQPISVTISYDPNDLSNVSSLPLIIHRWDGDSWSELTDCSTNQVNSTITCSTVHFSVFGLFETTTPSTSNVTDISNSTSEASAPKCSDQLPGIKPPWLYGAIAQGSDSIDLYFTESDSPVTNYVLEYGTKSGEYQYGVQDMNVNKQYQMKFTVQLLSSNTLYYFRVRAQNGCATGNWSNEISAKTKAITPLNQIEIVDFELTPGDEDVQEISTCGTYVVQPGDSLWSIASNILGDSNRYADIIEQNKNTYPSLLESNSVTPDWKLKINCNEELMIDTQGVSRFGERRRYDVKIKVVNSSMKPIKSAEVTLHSTPQTTKTNEQGIANFTGVEPGEHKVIIAYKNYKGEQSINLTGDVKEFSLNVTVKQAHLSFPWQAYVAISAITVVTLFFTIKLIRSM